MENLTPMMSHNVYFALNDSSAGAAAKLIASCYKYLPSHDGIVSFSSGLRVKESDRPVNVCDWNVALHIVFENKEHDDNYQTSDDHHKFIEENKQTWKTVRVFDSFIPEKQ